jgi:hypothetical protein
LIYHFANDHFANSLRIVGRTRDRRDNAQAGFDAILRLKIRRGTVDLRGASGVKAGRLGRF